MSICIRISRLAMCDTLEGSGVNAHLGSVGGKMPFADGPMLETCVPGGFLFLAHVFNFYYSQVRNKFCWEIK